VYTQEGRGGRQEQREEELQKVCAVEAIWVIFTIYHQMSQTKASIIKLVRKKQVVLNSI
jgi:hypothetical protein